MGILLKKYPKRKRIVILGAGSAGVMLANRLDRTAGKKAEIMVIEKNERHYYQPGFTLVAFGLEKEKNLVRPTGDLLRKRVILIQDEVVGVNPDKNTVVAKKTGEITYDYLVVATGAKLDSSEPEGLEEALKKGENVFTFYNLEGAVKLRGAVKKFAGGTVVVATPEMPYKCPAAPVKFILMMDDMLRRKGIRNKCELIYATPMPRPFSREPYASKIDGIFREKEIKAVSSFNLAELDAEKKAIISYEGANIAYDMLVVVPPQQSQDIIFESPDMSGGTGWLACDRHAMRHTKYPNIYGIGDTANFPTSKTASGARKQAKVLAARLADLLKGEEPSEIYDGEIICPVLTGFGRAMFAHFNYKDNLSPAKDSRMQWMIKIHLLRRLYWNLMLPGLL